MKSMNLNRLALPTLFMLMLSFSMGILSCGRKKIVKDIPIDPLTTVEFDGRQRSYRLHVPQVYWDGADTVPLIFAIHGGGGDAESMIHLSLGGINDLSDTENFIVCYPEGVDKGWNDGRGATVITAHEENIDDVGYFEFLIEELSAEYHIDAKMIYATGISNGGFMSNRLACDLPDKFAAVAPVASALPKYLDSTCAAQNGVAYLCINGTDDSQVGYDATTVQVLKEGESRGERLTVPQTIDFWVAANGCGTSATTTSFDDNPDDETSIEHSVYTSCTNNAEVHLYKVIDGGHTWPSGWEYLADRLIGKTSKEINANEVIWTFFKNHPKP